MLIVIAIAVVFYYNPSTKTNDASSSIRVCDKGMCAAKPLKKDEAIGIIASINKDSFNYTAEGRMIKKTDDAKAQNVSLHPLYIDKGRVDYYIYAKQNIDEGDQIVSSNAH